MNSPISKLPKIVSRQLVLNIFIYASADESEVFYLTGDLVSAIRLQGII